MAWISMGNQLCLVSLTANPYAYISIFQQDVVLDKLTITGLSLIMFSFLKYQENIVKAIMDTSDLIYFCQSLHILLPLCHMDIWSSFHCCNTSCAWVSHLFALFSPACNILKTVISHFTFSTPNLSLKLIAIFPLCQPSLVSRLNLSLS